MKRFLFSIASSLFLATLASCGVQPTQIETPPNDELVAPSQIPNSPLPIRTTIPPATTTSAPDIVTPIANRTPPTIPPTQGDDSRPASPDYSIIPPLSQLVVTKKDRCLTDYELPIISEYLKVSEYDLTPSTRSEYCATDCVRRRWVAEGGSKLTLTVARLPTAADAAALLRDEWEQVAGSHSDWLGGVDDPYTGSDDAAWMGIPTPGLTAYYAFSRSVVFMFMEWTKVPQGYDIDWSLYAMENLAQLQLEKINEALGTPRPPLLSTPLAGCVP